MASSTSVLSRCARTYSHLPARTPSIFASSSISASGSRSFAQTTSPAPLKVAVTGAAGAIGYSIVLRIAAGGMLGYNQPVHLNLLELPHALKTLKGVEMEIHDGAFPLLHKLTCTDNLEEGFGDADICILVGAKPRGPGMERADLMSANAKIFAEQGKTINAVAKKTTTVLVVGNPANTNALVLSANAPNIDPKQIHAMTRLDQNRAIAQVALKSNSLVRDVEKVIIWGNHSVTQYPDISHATIHGKSAKSVINDPKWIVGDFIPRVQKRGAEIIAARGASSAASAGNAAMDHIRDLYLGSGDKWNSIALRSDGSYYGIEKDLWYSVPVMNKGNGQVEIVRDLPIDDFSRKLMDATMEELKQERDAVLPLLPKGWGK